MTCIPTVIENGAPANLAERAPKEQKCYALLAKGDPYAHLPLPGIKADLSAIESQLDRQFAPEAQNVQYT